MQVKDFLRGRGIAFKVLEHQPTFSAQRMAEAVHVSGERVAKCVLLKADGGYVLAVLPATHQIYIDMARDALGAEQVEIADEDDLQRVFPDCEVGVVPPFGSQYGLQTLVDTSLTEDDEIVFEANQHHESIRLKYQSFEHLEHPTVGMFAYHAF